MNEIKNMELRLRVSESTQERLTALIHKKLGFLANDVARLELALKPDYRTQEEIEFAIHRFSETTAEIGMYVDGLITKMRPVVVSPQQHDFENLPSTLTEAPEHTDDLSDTIVTPL